MSLAGPAHELGHSDSLGDVMFPSMPPEVERVMRIELLGTLLSESDRTTLRRLYARGNRPSRGEASAGFASRARLSWLGYSRGSIL